MKFAVDLRCLPPLTLKDVFLTSVQIRSLFSEAAQRLATEPEWQQTLAHLGGAPSRLGLLFCDDLEMRRLQLEHRRLDRTTDILSFPLREVPGMEGAFAWIPQAERSLGDLVVSLPTVERGARRGRRTAAEELREVLLHGLLHLVGCEHVGVSARRAARMRHLQKDLFNGSKGR